MFSICNIRTAARRTACVSLLLGVMAVVIYLVPNIAQHLQYDTTAIASGELWRVVTCHITHWSLDHLVWDVGALLVLGALSEVPYRRAFAWCVTVSTLLIPLAVWMLMPELNAYRGLSGIDSALFVLLAVMMLGESLTARQYGWTALCTTVLLAFAGKVGYEYIAETTLFVNSAEADMIPIPLAHVVGGLVGGACAAYASLASRETRGETCSGTTRSSGTGTASGMQLREPRSNQIAKPVSFPLLQAEVVSARSPS